MAHTGNSGKDGWGEIIKYSKCLTKNSIQLKVPIGTFKRVISSHNTDI